MVARAKTIKRMSRAFLKRTMRKLSPETVWHMDEAELLDVLDDDQYFSRPKKIYFYAPSFMYYKTSYYCSSAEDFPTISVTGKGCALKCRHCGGIVLETMYPAVTPKMLFELCAELKIKGAVGCLISGGCQPDGSVPLSEFIDAIGKVKHELDLTVLVHTGIIDLKTAEGLKEAGVDSALIDIIGSNETIREIYKLNVTIEDYENSLGALDRAGLVFVPHVIVGLHYGKLEGELKALEMISRHAPSALVIIAFMPVHGTEMEKVKPPTSLDIAKVITAARLMFPKTPLTLGCMRPKGGHRAETDILAIKAGVNAIAFPTEKAVEFAENQGYKTVFSSLCCSQIYSDIKS
jgi:uncharacterized radical SAM superfamily protein